MCLYKWLNFKVRQNINATRVTQSRHDVKESLNWFLNRFFKMNSSKESIPENGSDFISMRERRRGESERRATIKKAVREMLPVFVKRPQWPVNNKYVFWLVFIVTLRFCASLFCLSSFLFDPLSRPDSLLAD